MELRGFLIFLLLRCFAEVGAARSRLASDQAFDYERMTALWALGARTMYGNLGWSDTGLSAPKSVTAAESPAAELPTSDAAADPTAEPGRNLNSKYDDLRDLLFEALLEDDATDTVDTASESPSEGAGSLTGSRESGDGSGGDVAYLGGASDAIQEVRESGHEIGSEAERRNRGFEDYAKILHSTGVAARGQSVDASRSISRSIGQALGNSDPHSEGTGGSGFSVGELGSSFSARSQGFQSYLRGQWEEIVSEAQRARKEEEEREVVLKHERQLAAEEEAEEKEEHKAPAEAETEAPTEAEEKDEEEKKEEEQEADEASEEVVGKEAEEQGEEQLSEAAKKRRKNGSTADAVRRLSASFRFRSHSQDEEADLERLLAGLREHGLHRIWRQRLERRPAETAAEAAARAAADAAARAAAARAVAAVFDDGFTVRSADVDAEAAAAGDGGGAVDGAGAGAEGVAEDIVCYGVGAADGEGRRYVLKRFRAGSGGREPEEQQALQNQLTAMDRVSDKGRPFLRVHARSHTPADLARDKDAEVLVMLSPFSTTLRQFVEKRVVGAKRRLGMFFSVLAGVDDLWRKGVAHSSRISPDNILVTGDLESDDAMAEHEAVLCPSLLRAEAPLVGGRQRFFVRMFGGEVAKEAVSPTDLLRSDLRQCGELLEWLIGTAPEEDRAELRNYEAIAEAMKAGLYTTVGGERGAQWAIAYMWLSRSVSDLLVDHVSRLRDPDRHRRREPPLPPPAMALGRSPGVHSAALAGGETAAPDGDGGDGEAALLSGEAAPKEEDARELMEMLSDRRSRFELTLSAAAWQHRYQSAFGDHGKTEEELEEEREQEKERRRQANEEREPWFELRRPRPPSVAREVRALLGDWRPKPPAYLFGCPA